MDTLKAKLPCGDCPDTGQAFTHADFCFEDCEQHPDHTGAVVIELTREHEDMGVGYTHSDGDQCDTRLAEPWGTP